MNNTQNNQAFWDKPQTNNTQETKKKNVSIKTIGLITAGITLTALPFLFKTTKEENNKGESVKEKADADLLEREKIKAIAKKMGSKGGKKSVAVKKAKKEKKTEEESKDNERKT